MLFKHVIWFIIADFEIISVYVHEMQISLLNIPASKFKLIRIFHALYQKKYIEGLVQDYSNSSALAMGLLQSYAKFSIEALA